MVNNLEKSIISTIAYFDVFNYPLTLVEIWKWLYQPSRWPGESDSLFNFLEIEKILEEGNLLKSLVENRRGFYFLKGKSDLIELRQARYNLAERKFKKALRVAKIMKKFPGIKMIAVCNNLAWSNASEESDIDFFIITEKKKIWTARFFAAGFLKIFGLRPTKKSAKDKICLSFFVDEENLKLEKISIDEPDIYLIYWIAQLAPVYDEGGVYQKFLEANNWVKKYLPNFFGGELSDRRNAGSVGWTVPRFGFGEKFFRRMQIDAMPAGLKELSNKDSRVVVTDLMLKFHANDRRAGYKKKWEEKMVKLFNDYEVVGKNN